MIKLRILVLVSLYHVLYCFIVFLSVDGHVTIEEGPFLSERVQGFSAGFHAHGPRSEPLHHPSSRRQVRPETT